MNYQFILLDVDGTLMDFNACEAQAFKRGFETFGFPWSEEVYQTYHELNARIWERHERGELTREELLSLRFNLLFEQVGIDGDGEAFESLYREYLADGAFLENGAMELLLKLEASACQTYIVTNGLRSTQEKRLRTTGIDRHVDGIFISEDIGWQKPTVEYFDYCFARIPGFVREKAIIVGESLSADIRGGINAGITTCWYNPGRKAGREIRPDFEVRTLEEVWRIVAG